MWSCGLAYEMDFCREMFLTYIHCCGLMCPYSHCLSYWSKMPTVFVKIVWERGSKYRNNDNTWGLVALLKWISSALAFCLVFGAFKNRIEIEYILSVIIKNSFWFFPNKNFYNIVTKEISSVLRNMKIIWLYDFFCVFFFNDFTWLETYFSLNILVIRYYISGRYVLSNLFVDKIAYHFVTRFNTIQTSY